MEGYEEAFEYVFNNTDVKDVATTGYYSSGKSSLFEYYKKRHSDKKLMHISLAQFEQTTNQKAAEKDKETKINMNIFCKLSVQGNEIEIFGEDDNSYFDK